MKDFEKAEEEEEEKIRVEVGFFAHYFISERLLSRLVSSRDVLNWIFHLSSSSSLFREEHSMRLTRLSLSLYSSSFSRNGRQHCELGAWVKVESGETQKWFGRVRFM
jgi:hypothetical protein